MRSLWIRPYLQSAFVEGTPTGSQTGLTTSWKQDSLLEKRTASFVSE